MAVGACLALVLPALLAAHLVVLHVWPGSYAWMTGGAELQVPLLILIPVTLAAAAPDRWRRRWWGWPPRRG